MKLSHWIQWSFVWTFVGGVFVGCSGEYRTFDVGSGIDWPRLSVPTGMSLPEAQFASRTGTFDIQSRYWSKSRRGEYPEESEDAYSTLPVDNEPMGQFDQMTMGTEQPQVTINRGDMEHTMTITMPRMERHGNRMIKKFVVQPVIQYVVQYDKNEGGEEGSASHFEEFEASQSQDDPGSTRGDDVERLFNNVDANFDSYWGNDENGSGGPYYQEGNNDFDFSSGGGGDWQNNNINNNNNNVQQQQQQQQQQQGVSNGQNGHANGMQNMMHQQNSMPSNMQPQNGMHNNMQQPQQQQPPPPSLNAFVSVEYPSYQKSPSMGKHNSANGGMSLSNAVQMSNAQQQHSPAMQMNGGGGQMGMQHGGPPSGAASMPMQMQQMNPMGDMNNGMMMQQRPGMGMPMNSGPPAPPPRTRYGVPGMMPGMPLGSQYGVPGMVPGPPLGTSPPQMMMQMQPAPPMPMMSSPQPMMPMQMPSHVPQQQASMPPSTTVPAPMMQMQQQQFTSAMPMMTSQTPQMVSTQQTTTTTAAAPSEGYEPPPPPPPSQSPSYGPPSSTPAPYGPPAESSGGWSAPGKKPNRPKGRGRGKFILAHLPKLPASIGGHLSFMFSTGVGKGRRGGRGWKPGAAQADDKHNKSTTIDREQVSDHILNILGLTVHHSPGHSRLNATSLSSFNPIVMWEQLGNETSLNHTSNLQPTILLQGNMLEDTSSPSTPVDRSSDGGEEEKQQVSSTINEVLISANPTNNTTTPLTITTTTPTPITHNYTTPTDQAAQFITTTPITPTHPTPTTHPIPVNSIKKQDHLIIKPAITLVPFSTLTVNSSRIFPISHAPVPRDTSPSQFQPTPNSPITYIKPIVNMKQVPKLTPHRQFFEVDKKPDPTPTTPSPTIATSPISHLTPPPPPYDAVQEYINQNLSNNLFPLEENYNPKNSTVRPTVHAYYSDQHFAGHPVKVHFDPLIYDALQAAFQPYNKIYESVQRRRRRFYLPSYIDIRSRSRYPKGNQQNRRNSKGNKDVIVSS